MEVKAKIKNIRMSPRKIRLVVDAVRGLRVEESLNQLRFIKKLAARPVAKLVNSAIANAEHNFDLDKNNLYIKKITVNEGTALKRWMPKAHGRATPIRKRASHVEVLLGEIKESGRQGAKKIKIEAPVKLAGKHKEDEGVKIKEKEEKEIVAGEKVEKGKKIVDPRMEGRHGHAKIEGGGHKGFVSRMFRRKSG